jgi:hypothetical protein
MPLKNFNGPVSDETCLCETTVVEQESEKKSEKETDDTTPA